MNNVKGNGDRYSPCLIKLKYLNKMYAKHDTNIRLYLFQFTTYLKICFRNLTVHDRDNNRSIIDFTIITTTFILFLKNHKFWWNFGITSPLKLFDFLLWFTYILFFDNVFINTKFMVS